MKNGYTEYKSNQIETADARQLVVMLYEGAIKFIDNAYADIDNFKHYDKVNSNLLRAQDILTELMLSLDMEKGGEIADNLLNLYSYMKKTILDANMKKDGSSLPHVINLLTELKTAWQQIDISKVTISSINNSVNEKSSKGGFVAQG